MDKCDVALLGNEVAQLREQLEADQRFKKTLLGLDPTQVNDYTRAQREFSARLQAELGEARRQAEEARSAAERLRATLAEREGALARAQRLLTESEGRQRALHAQQEAQEQQLAALRESVEKQSLERLRSQLIAATREGSETSAQLAIKTQENRQLAARLDALAAEEKGLSAALAAEQERSQSLALLLDRAVARLKAHIQTNARTAAERLRETAQVLSACFAESEALLERLSESVPPEEPAPNGQ